MFKNVLVISDNAYLCQKFIEIIKKKNFEHCAFKFSISPFSNRKDFDFNDDQLEILDLRKSECIDYIKKEFDLVISIHCKQIFPIELISYVKCINVHPGFNPINRGWYPQVFSIINKTPIGATIHEIDDKLDHGHIIARELVTKSSFDTSETLYLKIAKKELELLEKNIENIINKNYELFEPEGEGNLYLKKDFNDLLEIKLEDKVVVGDFLDKLRALTHGDFRNAYFIDSNTGKKVFVTVNLIPDNNE